MRRGVLGRGLAAVLAITAMSASASAHGRSEISMDRWYAQYEARRAAMERRQLSYQDRHYERVMRRQRELARQRDRVEDYRKRLERRWTEAASRTYRDYERYCGDCSSYREYGRATRYYGYYRSHYPYVGSYGHYGHRRHYDRYADYGYGYGYAHHSQGYTYTTNGPPFTSYGYSEFARPYAASNDRLWSANDYPAGWSAWWSRMERDGRSGQQH